MIDVNNLENEKYKRLNKYIYTLTKIDDPFSWKISQKRITLLSGTSPWIWMSTTSNLGSKMVEEGAWRCLPEIWKTNTPPFTYLNAIYIKFHRSLSMVRNGNFDAYLSYFPTSPNTNPPYLGTCRLFPRQHYINNVNCIMAAFVPCIIRTFCPQYISSYVIILLFGYYVLRIRSSIYVLKIFPPCFYQIFLRVDCLIHTN